NHTSTHLMNLALRDILGDHVEQKGSLVDADKTRFDFTHAHSLSHDEIARIERHVNERIQSDLPVTAVILPLAEAKKLLGVRAVFGEKYPDPVRVVMIGAERPEQVTRELSTEFCGGTHLGRSSQAGLFKIVSQEPVAKGVRRVTAVTGKRAVETLQHLSAVVEDLTGKFNCKADELPARVAALQDELKKLQQQLKKGAAGEAAKIADGKGGGNPTLAQAGGKNPAKLGEALARAKELAREQLTSP